MILINKPLLIGMLTMSCILSTPCWNRFGNFQHIQLAIGQPAEAAPKFRMPLWVGKVIKGVGKEALNQVVSTSIDNLRNKPQSNKISSSVVGYVGNLCKSDTDSLYIVSANGAWIYYNGSNWTGISKPSRIVACYIDLAMNSSGDIYWRYSQQLFGYVPKVGWVMP